MDTRTLSLQGMVFAAALPSTTPKRVGSSLFFLLIYGQNDILKITSAKILCFFRVSIAKIQSNFKEKIARFLYVLQAGSKNIEESFKKKLTFMFKF